MSKPIRILLQTTLLPTNDDWSIDRFSMLRDYLVSLKDDAGNAACEVVARDRQLNSDGDDLMLSTLNSSDFDELWLFALDTGGGLSINDCAGITAFHRSGRGILTTRDHQDMGICMCCLGDIGAMHFFQSKHLNPDEAQRCIDDTGTPTISWPNYHSGHNGDYQRLISVEPIHPLLHNPASPSGIIKLFPAHPHEGAVGVPAGSKARVIATGISQTTGRSFNLVVVLEQAEETGGDRPGRVIAQSTFHHFADYNWNISNGCPSFVTEPSGDGMQTEPSALADIHAYVWNVVDWLSPLDRDDHSPSRITQKTRLQTLDRVGIY